jgi:hypothetical protein
MSTILHGAEWAIGTQVGRALFFGVVVLGAAAYAKHVLRRLRRAMHVRGGRR